MRNGSKIPFFCLISLVTIHAMYGQFPVRLLEKLFCFFLVVYGHRSGIMGDHTGLGLTKAVWRNVDAHPNKVHGAKREVEICQDQNFLAFALSSGVYKSL